MLPSRAERAIALSDRISKRRLAVDRPIRYLHRASFLRVVVPSRVPDGNLLVLDDWVQIALRIVLPHSGGGTELRGVGHWLDFADNLVSEPVAVLDIYLRLALSADASRALVGELVEMAGRMNQEALAVAIGHRLFLLRPPRVANGLVDPPQRQTFLRRTALNKGLGNGRVHTLPNLRTEGR